MSFFGGWYFKIESESETFAFIVGKSESGKENSAFIQIIKSDGSKIVDYPADEYRFYKSPFLLKLGGNVFDESGMWLNIEKEGVSLHGCLAFDNFSSPGYDIMGPFRFLPGLECRHSVISVGHNVNGQFFYNGKRYIFKNARGYIEGDSGRSFPSEYAWSQCFFPNGSLMFSVAKVPVGPICITGVIGIIRYNGRQYRLGTYLGASAKNVKDGEIIIKQGKSEFRAVLPAEGHMLAAPQNGKMSRSIREGVRCNCEYSFYYDKRKIFGFAAKSASAEYEYKR